MMRWELVVKEETKEKKVGGEEKGMKREKMDGWSR